MSLLEERYYVKQLDSVIGVNDPQWSWDRAFPSLRRVEDGIWFQIRFWNPGFQMPSNGPELSEAVIIAGQHGVQESSYEVVRSGRCIDCGLRVYASRVELVLPSGRTVWATDRSGCECVVSEAAAVKYRGRECIALADKYGIVPQALRPFLVENFSWGMVGNDVGAFTQSKESVDAVRAFLDAGASFSELLSRTATPVS